MKAKLTRLLTLLMMNLILSSCATQKTRAGEKIKSLCQLDFIEESCWTNKKLELGLPFSYFKEFNESNYYLINEADLVLIYKNLLK